MIYSQEPISVRAFQQHISTTSNEYKKFIKKVNYYFTSVRMVKIDSKNPISQVIALQRIMFLTIIQTLKYKNKDRKYIKQMLQSQQEGMVKQCKKQKEYIKKIQDIIADQIYNDLISANKQFQGLNLNQYFSSFIRLICTKKEQKNFLGKLSMKYDSNDFVKVKKSTKVDLHYLVYQDDKEYSSPQFQKTYAQDGYILSAKKVFYILYSRGSKAAKKANDLDQIKVLKNSVISAKDLQKLFQKPQQTKQIKSQSSLFPDDVSCYVCSRLHSEFDSLYWNYSGICTECLANPAVDTSNIPSSIIQKYLRDRNLSYRNYDIICPQCQSIATIKDYNPASKPKKFRCNTCTKTICVNHSCNIYDCFCICRSCNKPTIYMDKMQINYCQFCRKRFCFKCKTLGKKFCNCICKQCLGQNNQKHICTKKCHQCLNSPSKLRECKCGLFTCYSCYYRNLTNSKNRTVFCNFVEFD